MNNDINEYLDNTKLDYNLSYSYIHNIFLQIKMYLQYLNYKRYKLKKKYILPIIYNYIHNNLKINYNVIKISKIKQPPQRSENWYNIRYNIISASDASSVLNKNFDYVSDSEKKKIYFKKGFKTKNDLIKVKVLRKEEFTGNIYTQHGIIFEEIASLIYQKRNNIRVIDFGLIRHPNISYLGASPDGITQNSIMLEIKCPYKRHITGIIPSNYWVQMQLQLECCDLDRCDFVEIKVNFYNNSIDYYNDKYNDNNTLFTNNNLEKGILIKYINNDNIEDYIYPTFNDYSNYDSLELWAENTFTYYSSIYSSVEKKYWKIEQYSCISVFRDINWFKNTLPIFKNFWNIIQYYKKNLIDFNNNIIKKKSIKKSIKKSNLNTLIISDSDNDEEQINLNTLIISDSDNDEEQINLNTHIINNSVKDDSNIFNINNIIDDL